MDSDSDTACAVGCPIRRSRDQRLLASPPGLSQRATSFIASQCQGIHQRPFVSRLSTTPNGKYQRCIAAEPTTADAAISLEDTYRTQTSLPLPKPRSSSCRRPGRVRLGHTHLFTHSINDCHASVIDTNVAERTSYRVTFRGGPWLAAHHQKWWR